MLGMEIRSDSSKSRRKLMVPRLVLNVAVSAVGLLALFSAVKGYPLALVALFGCVIFLLFGLKPLYDIEPEPPTPGSHNDPDKPLTTGERKALFLARSRLILRFPFMNILLVCPVAFAGLFFYRFELHIAISVLAAVLGTALLIFVLRLAWDDEDVDWDNEDADPQADRTEEADHRPTNGNDDMR